ncbi:retropepsin-like aspartic protease family protein [Lutibaculum baratangense]|uniref:TIGR02281 family clan AA aspartic protease n=1 Tax=Lutibaculum baratangense AMV1 TaxID=631454 RepID=V4RUH8_9HYPH|nr:TIGR02281 family clan AA aspartic protease [Lutibaculum baratangense]ESR26730.1 hypothetical protein N177_0514 [Lutibaculum baratangense AMV1]
MRAGLALSGVGVLVLAGLILANSDPSQDILGLDQERFAAAAALGALLLVIGGGFLASFIERPGAALRAIVLWSVFGFTLMGLYTHRVELAEIAQRTIGGVVPGLPVVSQTGDLTEITLNRGLDRHFMARASVNGANTVFMVDTGASRVTLTANTARAADLPIDRLNFSTPVRTANGMALVAPATIASLEIGPAVFRDVAAFVAPEGTLDFDLLGVSALDRLDSYEVRGDQMVLRVHH